MNIATQERKVCHIEIEIIISVLKGSVKLTSLHIDRSKI